MSDKYYYLIEEKYDDWKETLNHCGLFLLKESDDKIGYHVFDEFDIGVRIYCTEEMLVLLCENGFITEEMKTESIELMTLFCEIQIQEPQLWNIESLRKHPRWKKVMELADLIKSQLYV